MVSKKYNLFILLIGLLVTPYMEADGYPCKKYKFDFNQEVVPGNIIISWSINTGLNRCGEFQKEDITKHSYVIVVSNLQGDVLLSDTIAQNWFAFNVLENEALAHVRVAELNGDEYIDTLLKRKHITLFELDTKIDSINFYLTNGLILNALYQLHSLNLQYLRDSLIQEFTLLFPEHYPHNQDFFNCYLDPESLLLKKMLYTRNLTGFSKSLNKGTKTLTKKPEDIYINIISRNDHSTTRVEVFPEELTSLVLSSLTLLEFDHTENQEGLTTLLITRKKNGRFYYVKNSRALTNPNSPGFQKKFPYTGPIH